MVAMSSRPTGQVVDSNNFTKQQLISCRLISSQRRMLDFLDEKYEGKYDIKVSASPSQPLSCPTLGLYQTETAVIRLTSSFTAPTQLLYHFVPREQGCTVRGKYRIKSHGHFSFTCWAEICDKLPAKADKRIRRLKSCSCKTSREC